MKQIPLPEINLIPDDNNASKEAESFENANLEEVARRNAHQRKEHFKAHFAKAALIVFWIIVVSFLTIALIWVYHLITPEEWHFLTTLQIDKLQTILMSATVIKIGQDYLNKHF